MILFYLFSINAPLVYYFEYKINLDNIVKYLCEQKDEEENLCLGNCYLKKNLNKVEKTQLPEQSRTLEIPSSNVAPHFVNKFDVSFNQSESKTNFPPLKINNIVSVDILPETLPPELLSV